MSSEFELCVDILMKKTNKTSARDQQTLADFLTRVQTFRGMCSKEELNERLVDIAKYLEFEEVEEGNAIFHKGEDSLYFYIILQGSVSVFIPKAAKDIDLEERWRKQLDRLIAEYGDIGSSGAKNGGLGISTSKSIVNQINQGKKILRYLRCQEDEELLKSNNGLRYFRDDICTFKKIQKLGENESFGESILSSSEQQRTATLIASDGVPFFQTSQIKQSENEGENSIAEAVEGQENNCKKVVLLAKVTKWNFLKVFQYELDKRSFIRKCLLSNYKNDLSDKVLDTLTFQFKEEHFEKGAHIVKQIENGTALSDQKMVQNQEKSNSNREDLKRKTGLNTQESNSESEDDDESGGSPLSRQKRKQRQQSSEKKRGSMVGDNSETEYLYLLYKGSIEVRQRIVTNSSKSQVKNIDSHILRQQVVAHANKIDVPLAHLTESEFFGHENWFKEDPDRIFNNYEGDYSPEQAFKDKLLQIKKDFSIIVRETDTVVFKISRKFLSEEQNRLLLYSLIQHGKQRHNRYMQICKDIADKTDDTFQKQLKQQIEFLTQEKNSKLVSQGTIQAPTVVIPTSQVGNNADDIPFSGSSLSPRKTMNDIQLSPKNKLRSEADENNMDNSPTCKIKLKNEFETFRKRFEGAYKFTATQPILPSPEYAEIQFQQMQLQQLKRQSTISPAKSRRDNSESPSKRSFADLTMSPKKRSNEGSASPSRTAYDGGMSPSKRFSQEECASPLKLRSQSPSKKSLLLGQNQGNQDGSVSPTRIGDGYSTARLSLGQIPEYFEGSEKNIDSSSNFPLVTLNHIQPSKVNELANNENPIEDGFTAAYNNTSPKKQLVLRTLQRHSSMPNTEELDIVKRNGPSLHKQESCLNLEGSPRASSPSRKSNQFQELKVQQHSQQMTQSENNNFMLPSVSSFFHEPFSETRKKIALQVAKSKMGGMTASLRVASNESTTPARFAWPEPAEVNEFSPKRKTEISQGKSFSEQIPVFTKTVSVMNDNGYSLPSEQSFETPLAAIQTNDRHNENQPKQQSTISKLNQLSIKLTKSKLTQQQSMTYEKNIPLLIKSLLQKKDSAAVRTGTPVAAKDNQEVLPRKSKLSASSSQPTLISLQNAFNLTKEPGDFSANKPQNITPTTKNVVVFSKPNVSTPNKNTPVVPNLNLNTPPVGLEATPENLKVAAFRAPQHSHGRSLINLNKVQHDLNESAPIFMFPTSQSSQQSQKLLTKSQHSLFDPHPSAQQQPQFSNLSEESQPYILSSVQPSNPAHPQPSLLSQSSYSVLSLKNLNSKREITESSPRAIPQKTFPSSNYPAQQDNKIKFLVTISNSSRIPSWQEKSSPVKGIPNSSMTSRSGQILKGSQLYSINEAKKESLKNEFLRRKIAESSDFPELQQSLDSGFPKNRRLTNQISSENLVHDYQASQHSRIGSLQLQSTFNNNDNSNSSSNLGTQTYRNSETTDGLTSQAFPSSNKAHSPAGSRINSFYYQTQSSVSPAAKLRKAQKQYAILSSTARPPESLSSQLQQSTFRQTASQQQAQMYQTKQQQQTNVTKNNINYNGNSSSSYLNLNLVPSQNSLFDINQSSQSQLIHAQPKRLQVMKPNIQPHQTLSQINQSIGKETSTQCAPNLLLKAEKKGIHPQQQRESFKTVGSETDRGNVSRSNDREKKQKQQDFQQQQSLTAREEIMTQPTSDTFEKARIVMNMKKLSFPKRAIFDQSPNKGLQARILQSCYKQK